MTPFKNILGITIKFFECRWKQILPEHGILGLVAHDDRLEKRALLHNEFHRSMDYGKQMAEILSSPRIFRPLEKFTLVYICHNIEKWWTFQKIIFLFFKIIFLKSCSLIYLTTFTHHSNTIFHREYVDLILILFTFPSSILRREDSEVVGDVNLTSSSDDVTHFPPFSYLSVGITTRTVAFLSICSLSDKNFKNQFSYGKDANFTRYSMFWEAGLKNWTHLWQN